MEKFKSNNSNFGGNKTLYFIELKKFKLDRMGYSKPKKYFSFLKNLSTYRFQEKFNLSFALGSGVRSQNPRKSSV
jgi:hypothetical protein